MALIRSTAVRVATVAAIAVMCAACGSHGIESSSSSPAAASTARGSDANRSSSLTATPVVHHYHPSRSNPQTWPDACQMLTRQHLHTIWNGRFTQTASHQIPGGGKSSNNAQCEYRGKDAHGNFLYVLVARLFVSSTVDKAHLGFTIDRQAVAAGGGARAQTESIGDEAYYSDHGGVIARQGPTLWAVAIVDTDEDATTRKAQTEKLARMVAREFS